MLTAAVDVSLDVDALGIGGGLERAGHRRGGGAVENSLEASAAVKVRLGVDLELGGSRVAVIEHACGGQAPVKSVQLLTAGAFQALAAPFSGGPAEQRLARWFYDHAK